MFAAATALKTIPLLYLNHAYAFASAQAKEEHRVKAEHTDKVITIHDYYDGIVLGVATFHGAPCIYESDFYETGNAASDLFYLTPIEPDVLHLILEEWEKWIQYMQTHQSAAGWQEQNKIDLHDIAKQSADYRKYLRHGRFQGSYPNFHSPLDNLSVIWFESSAPGTSPPLK